jgi:peptide/nickel transport system substrate-binding protein
MKRLRLIFPIAAITMACGTDRGTSSTSPTGGTVIASIPGDAAEIFPAFVGEQNGAVVRDLVFDRLAAIGPGLNTVGDKGFTPQLAKSWMWANDSLSVAFSLDPKARWHDGKPVTAADVKYSFATYADPKTHSPVAPLLANIDSVSVRDSSTAVFHFKKRTPEQFYDVAFQLFIVPEHVYGKIPLEALRTSELIKTPIGSGRFRFVGWEPDVRIELVADTANYRGRPKLDRVTLMPYTEPAAAAAQVLTNQSDFIQAYPIDRIAELDSSKVARAQTVPTQQYTFLGMNPFVPRSTRHEPHPIFSDIRVRRALSMAVDRTAMLHNVFGDLGRIGHGPFPMGLTTSDSTLRLPPYDTAAAAALLDSAGWKRGSNGMRSKNGRPLRFSMISLATSVPRNKYAVLLQEAFRRLGVRADIEQMDGKAFQAHVVPEGNHAGDFDTMLNAFQPDPSVSGAKQNWATEGIGPEGQNWLFYSNKTVDAALDSSIASFDPAKAKAYASRAFQQVIDDVPAIWLYDVIYVAGVNRRVEVPPLRSEGWHANLADWSIAPDKRILRDRLGVATPAKK